MSKTIIPCVYLVRSSQFYKIGHTGNLYQRVREIEAGPETVQIIDRIIIPGKSERLRVERRLHLLLIQFRVRREWFNLPSLEIWYKAKSTALGSERISYPLTKLSARLVVVDREEIEKIPTPAPKSLPPVLTRSDCLIKNAQRKARLTVLAALLRRG